MNAGEDARAHQEGPQHAHREGDHPEHDGPHAQRVARGEHAGGVKQRGRGEPGHQRGVLDRVPEPPAAPAQLVIGPVGSRSDAHGEEHPGAQHPGTHRAGEIGSDLPGEQRADREAEGDRQPDIAEIERRRVEGETDVLQQRVEPHPHFGGDGQPLERIRAEQQESVEPQRHEALRGEHRLHRAVGQPPFDHRDQPARQRHHRDPQQHRALVIAPGARELEHHGLERMRIARDQLHRQIGDREDIEQRAERKGRKQALHHRGGADQRAERSRLVRAHRQEPRDRLQRRQRGGEPQRGQTQLRDHSSPTVVSSAIRAACISLMPSSSRGM